MRKKEIAPLYMALNLTLERFSFSPPQTQKILRNVNETNILAYIQ